MRKPRYTAELQAAFLDSGTLGLERSVGRPRRGQRPIGPAEEVRRLREKIGEQQVVIDFLAQACKRVGASTQLNSGNGGKPSTR